MIDLRIFANRMPGRRSTGLFNYIDKTLMADNKRIKTALVSVFHKDGLDELLISFHGRDKIIYRRSGIRMRSG